ncbi:kinase-like protein [Zopfia rhizophila CBS 207.26]|uniref:Autophagy-related protein 1 n=1 Tax=Zopfia rhizophila CBS 207.26 TaxID=1314779 RepID=A0A6A6E2V3_9PEZI|nr:kinase-like protein [Zopfia rhizophila CBS 207.26]
MAPADPRIIHDSSAITPPPTPTETKHPGSSSSSSASSTSIPKRVDPVTSTTGRIRGRSLEEKSVSTEPIPFPFWFSEYEISDWKKPLGSGLWSDVYLAKPCLPSATPSPSTQLTSILTPPLTPTKSRASSLSKREQLPQVPKAYAIKIPTSRTAKQVLSDEARVLSYLSRCPDSEKYIVPFYGQDMRTEALVLKAMNTTPETWVHKDLDSLGESERARKLATVYPSLALNLLRGLEWLEDKGCIHADIKPSNILLSTSEHTLHAVYSDFSSATLSHASSSSSSQPSAPLGGGTWDFLDPAILSKSSPQLLPTPVSDLWSLAITLLYVIIGASPFECAGSNVFRRREIIKHGQPLPYAFHGDEGLRNQQRLSNLSKSLGWDVGRWFGMVLKRDPAHRCDVGTWCRELEAGVSRSGVVRI